MSLILSWFIADYVTLTNVGYAEVAVPAVEIALVGVLDVVDDLEGVDTRSPPTE